MTNLDLVIPLNAHPIAELRHMAGLTQAELAHRLGCAPQVVSAAEARGHNVSLETLHRYAAALGFVVRLTATRAAQRKSRAVRR